MSVELHVIYRHVGPTSWEAYSRPVSIHADGRTLQEARQAFAAAAEAHFGRIRQTIEVIEHRELLVLPDVYVRIATDRWTLDREKVAAVLRRSLTVPAQVEMLAASNSPVASTGDIVFVACVESDRLDWLTLQLGRADAFQVACLRWENAVWWMSLATPEAELLQDAETLAQAGLASPTSTVADLMAVDPDPVTAPGAPPLPDTPATAPNRAARRRRDKTKRGGALMRPRRRAMVAA